MADTPTPLCTVTQLQEGAFADLTARFSAQALNDIVAEATRACETETSRRLAPFTITETHRAQGVDPDEYSAVTGGIPMDIFGSLGTSYANALGGVGDMVRHVWLNECAPHYPDMWSYSNVTISLTRSIGGTQTVALLDGPAPDTGHVWFRLGTFAPIGSLIKATYSGGYSTVPADLVRACKYMAAAICMRELDPMHAQSFTHDPGNLESLAVSWLAPYGRAL